MIDPLLARAILAMEENREAREQRRKLQAQHDRAISELRRAMLESAMVRAEIKAYRDNKE